MSFVVSLYHCRKIVLVLIGISLSVSRFLITLFSFRFKGNGISVKHNFETGETISNENVEEECDESSFTFKFPAFDEFIIKSKTEEEKGEFFSSDFFYIPPVKRYEFSCRQSVRRIVEEKQVVNLGVKHIYEDSSFISEIVDKDDKFVRIQECLYALEDEKNPLGDGFFLSEGDFVEQSANLNQEKGNNIVEEDETEDSEPFHVIGETAEENQECCYVLEVEEQNSSWHHHTINSHRNGFLSDGDFVEQFADLNQEKRNNIVVEDETEDSEPSYVIGETAEEKDDNFLVRNQECCCVLDVEQQRDHHTVKSHWNGFLSNGDFNEEYEECANNNVDSDNSSVAKSLDFADDNIKLESLWEHQELIEQLRMELKKAKATGLPTILEESESSPKITVDLKPWKIDEIYQHEDCMDELHTFYKSYTERMRKLDVYNYQKMYPIGFLKLKDPFQSVPRPNTSTEILKSKFSENFKHRKHKNTVKNDPMENFIKEIQSDLEVVYVGQMCLSWEFLHWQYKKALDLWESDQYGFHRFNEVAGEFQQFQVLLQRFLEDEAFQGPRVQYYIKNRGVNRKLLQVPIIREDGYGNRRNESKCERFENVITSYELVEMVEESIRILWRFIRADKDTCSYKQGGGSSPLEQQLQNPRDFELLKDIRNLVLKKEKELRSGKSLLKRLRACREDEEDSNQVLYKFFSLVDIKLVFRVLKMLKLTNEQLVWCHTKLNRINFEATKGILPLDCCSFLPFPC